MTLPADGLVTFSGHSSDELTLAGQRYAEGVGRFFGTDRRHARATTTRREAAPSAVPPLEITKSNDEQQEARPYRLVSAAALDDLPAPEWLVEECIPKNAIVSVIGAKGVMKTFVVLDLACHIATSVAWHGRRVQPGPVVYVYAEGPFGAKARLDAWCQHVNARTGMTFSRGEMPLWLLPSRIPVNDVGAIAALIVEIRQLPTQPSLIVIDTLNQNLDGDEDGKGMSGFVTGCSRLRDTFNTTVLAVHHTPLGSDDRGRGHTAFDGAVDTRLIVSRDDDRITLECTHQRNAADGWSVAYEAVPVAGSIALKPSSPSGGQLKGQRRQLLELVSEQGPMSYTAWLKASDLKLGSFKKARKWLADNAYVKQSGAKWAATDAGTLALRTPRDTGGIP